MVPKSVKRLIAAVTLLIVLVSLRAKGADPLDAQVSLKQGYETFDEAVTQLEVATGLKISCPADTTRVMQEIWKKGRFPTLWQDDFTKTRWPAKELITTVCSDLGLTWKLHPSDQTVLIDVPWRVPDSHSATELFQAIWKPGQESEFSKTEEWWRAWDGLLSKEENFASSVRVRQRAALESMLRLCLPNHGMEASRQTLTEASVVSTSGARYQCLFIIRPLQVSPGHGCMSYYCFDDRGTLKIADVVNTGHRQVVDRLLVNPRGPDGTGASDVTMVVRHNNNDTPRSLSFILQDDGLKLVDSSRAGESLLAPVK